MKHFLIVYDIVREAPLLPVREFDRHDTESAVAEYERLERMFRGRADIQVVLVASDSIETVRVTHGNLLSKGESLTELVQIATGSAATH
jgi:hypothetical protein